MMGLGVDTLLLDIVSQGERKMPRICAGDKSERKERHRKEQQQERHHQTNQSNIYPLDPLPCVSDYGTHVLITASSVADTVLLSMLLRPQPMFQRL